MRVEGFPGRGAKAGMRISTKRLKENEATRHHSGCGEAGRFSRSKEQDLNSLRGTHPGAPTPSAPQSCRNSRSH